MDERDMSGREREREKKKERLPPNYRIRHYGPLFDFVSFYFFFFFKKMPGFCIRRSKNLGLCLI